MAEIDIDSLVPPGPFRDAIVQEIAAVDERIDSANVNYKFLMQMIGDSKDTPSLDLLTVIIAARYMEHMNTWDGSPFLPVLFARLTAREVTR